MVVTEVGSTAENRSKWRWLVLLSVLFNVACGTFLFFQWKEGVLYFTIETQPSFEPNRTVVLSQSMPLNDRLNHLFSLTEQEVISLLSSQEMGANGYMLRELAVSVLEARGFEIQEPLRRVALAGVSMAEYVLKQDLERSVTLYFYSPLREDHFKALISYFDETVAPYSWSGLLARVFLCPDDGALQEALFRRDEWVLCKNFLKNKSDEEVLKLFHIIREKGVFHLLDYIRSGGVLEQAHTVFSPLFHENPTPAFADLFASMFSGYLLTQAQDAEVLHVLANLPNKSASGIRLTTRLLCTQRKPIVWDAAVQYLSKDESLRDLAQMDRDRALVFLHKKMGVSQSDSVKEPVKVVEEGSLKKQAVRQPDRKENIAPSTVNAKLARRHLQPYRVYVVKKGDTLWSIAKKWNVDVERLKYLNGLKGTSVPVGSQLRIPH